MSKILSQYLWVDTLKASKHPDVRCFCFHYAGGGSQMYRAWVDHLPKRMDLYSILLPGRERRTHEPLMTECHEIVEAMIPELLPLLDKPYVFFGYSMGALVAWALAKKIQNIGYVLPRHLFIAASRAPCMRKGEEKLYDLPSEQFIVKLTALGGIPEEILANHEIMDMYLPLLRADLTVADTYTPQDDEEQIDCPIDAFGGIGDMAITSKEIEGWKSHTRSSFHNKYFPDGHFFILHHFKEIIGEITNRLTKNDILECWGPGDIPS